MDIGPCSLQCAIWTLEFCFGLIVCLCRCAVLALCSVFVVVALIQVRFTTLWFRQRFVSINYYSVGQELMNSYCSLVIYYVEFCLACHCQISELLTIC
jgi:hypothetical protein